MRVALLSSDRKWFSMVLLIVLAVTVVLSTLDSMAEAASSAARFNGKGELLLPRNYRQWVFVGAPVTPNDLNDGKARFPEFHHVYIDPASFASYRKNGEFPNGTVFVKELVDVAFKNSASGNGYFPGEFTGLAVSVKDAKRFPNEPGHWAFFNFQTDNGKTLGSAKAQPIESCNSCHKEWAGGGDWVFNQYYPVLRDVIEGL